MNNIFKIKYVTDNFKDDAPFATRNIKTAQYSSETISSTVSDKVNFPQVKRNLKSTIINFV